jgi:hypothetical protein
MSTTTFFESHSADITDTLRNVESGRSIDHENDDEEFFAEFARVIDDATLPNADDKVDERYNHQDNRG